MIFMLCGPPSPPPPISTYIRELFRIKTCRSYNKTYIFLKKYQSTWSLFVIFSVCDIGNLISSYLLCLHDTASTFVCFRKERKSRLVFVWMMKCIRYSWVHSIEMIFLACFLWWNVVAAEIETLIEFLRIKSK